MFKIIRKLLKYVRAERPGGACNLSERCQRVTWPFKAGMFNKNQGVTDMSGCETSGRGGYTWQVTAGAGPVPVPEAPAGGESRFPMGPSQSRSAIGVFLRAKWAVILTTERVRRGLWVRLNRELQAWEPTSNTLGSRRTLSCPPPRGSRLILTNGTRGSLAYRTGTRPCAIFYSAVKC